MTNRIGSMDDRSTAVVVGVLFIIATAFLFIGQVFYGPYLEGPDYLDLAYPNRQISAVGILLEFLCILAIPLIPVFLYPVLKRHNEPFALAYMAFRWFEAVLYGLVLILTLSLISVSQQSLSRAGADAALFEEIGRALQSISGWTFSIYLLIFGFGAMFLYAALYQSRLVPRWLSGWGFLAAAFILLGGAIDIVDIGSQISEAGFELIFAPPIAINEMVLAVWLIVKGFTPEGIEAESTRAPVSGGA